MNLDEIKIRAFTAKDQFYAVIFPKDSISVVAAFWTTAGVGISSRFAEVNMEHLNRLAEVEVSGDDDFRPNFETDSHDLLQGRIIQHLERAPLTNKEPLPLPQDVYFYPTGMGAIYKVHSYILQHFRGTTILFGMAFSSTIRLFEDFGTEFKFFGLGTENDLDELESFLREEADKGLEIQAIWAEFPASPLLVTPDIARLHTMAKEYDAILILNDSIASFANVDITNVADVLISSLTKSFSGYADVVAGSAVLNPSSAKYPELKTLFDEHYVPELYLADAEAIERNSRDYLARTITLNDNASALVQYLHSWSVDPKSAIKKVHYPSITTSSGHYEQFTRPKTADFNPGYGCLFCVELNDLPTTIAFYDNLNVHKGPHLGGPSTIAWAYTMGEYGAKLDWAEKYGLLPTQIRVSVGLEHTALLLKEFQRAVEAANNARAEAVVYV